jgi:type 1 glutamine amidotransferase
VFYTSLGDPDDFATPEFNRLLLNAIAWATNAAQPAVANASNTLGAAPAPEARAAKR